MQQQDWDSYTCHFNGENDTDWQRNTKDIPQEDE